MFCGKWNRKSKATTTTEDQQTKESRSDPEDSVVDIMESQKTGAYPDDDLISMHSSLLRISPRNWTCAITGFILLLGCAVSGAFLALGISSANETQKTQFERSASDLVKKIESAWADYVNAAGVIHGRCRSRNFTRKDFRDMYEYLLGGGLSFQAAQFDPRITQAERPAAEEEARLYYAQNYPNITYKGIMGFNLRTQTEPEQRWKAPVYYPIHYMEPIPGNEKAIDLDYYASGSRRLTVEHCLIHGEPALTDRLRLVQETAKVAYGVVLMHPGYNLTSHDENDWPRDIASIVVRIPDLIQRSAQNQVEASSVYIYDLSDSLGNIIFLGAAKITPTVDKALIEPIPEVALENLQKTRYTYQVKVRAANKIWAIVVQADEQDFQPEIMFVVVGAAIIFVSSCLLGVWVYVNTRRVAKFNRLQAEAEAEKAALILESARKAADAERELNDFIAHEVRNPVAAAMSACSFVKHALNSPEPLKEEEDQRTIKEDVNIIENALKFVNDLLRNMLDMHRAANKQLKVTLSPTDILQDVLEPVHSMLVQRGGKIQVMVDCPPHLFALADRLRLNQVVLNLGRNSAKFVEEGFIRLRAESIDGYVEVSVEDSGSGIPLEKRERMFQKYQESLDVLSQGTGIGLFLCKNLVELMDGDIHLDDSYNSGIPNCPGTRFVVTLKESPPDMEFSERHDEPSHASHLEELCPPALQLPSKLNVLFVDDDPILRKLFSRSVQRVAPDWTIREASNGETALHLVESEKFDLIFMDMYMASVNKQLLGTEAVVELRRRGIDCKICGLSANDKEVEFLAAGADTFTYKPFPCEKNLLREELCRILCIKR